MLWAQEAGIELLHIPFRGAADAQQSVLGGNTVSLWDTLAAHAGGGAGAARSAASPSPARPAPPWCRTCRASSRPAFPAPSRRTGFLLAGPAGLSPEITGRLRTHLAAAMAEPAARDRWVANGIVSLGDPGPDEIGQFVAREAARWAPVVRASAA
jgi:tripartite-type tricarboxylate transporter receptor subunit TctC